MLFRFFPVRAPVGRAGLGHGPMAVRRAVLLACVAAVLPTVCAAPVSAPRVCALFLAGVQVADIASRCHVTARRVNQIVRDAGLRPAVQPKPSAMVLDRIIAAETARFGPNYGFTMLHGALLRLYPQWRFTRRAVYASLRRVAPTALRSRRDFAQYRLRRGHYHAPHFQYSCHLDLACKLQDLDDVQRRAARDGKAFNADRSVRFHFK